VSNAVRAFFALPLPEAALAGLLEARARLERCAGRSRCRPRWLAPEQLHLTLQFLGGVPADRVESFAGVADELARSTPPIASRFAGVTAFPNERRARVVVVELDDAAGRLAELATRVDAAAEVLGVPPEGRAFRPHVTLARIQRACDASGWLAGAELEPARADFTELRLYRSHLLPTGSVYEVLRSARLAGG
jgi:RNA 2',3'-cyclic 3'-phosphodiesterase